MRIAGRQWAAAFATAVLMHAGLVSAVLWYAPAKGIRHVAPAGIRVSLGTVAGTLDGASVAASDEAEYATAPSRQVVAVASAGGRPPTIPEPLTLRSTEAAEVRALERFGAGFDSVPVEPADATLVEESLPAASMQAKSVEATLGAGVAEAARFEELPPVKPVDASPSLDAAEVRNLASYGTESDAVPIELTDSAPFEESAPVEPSQAKPVDGLLGVEFAEAPRFEEASPVTPVDLSLAVEPADAKSTDTTPAREPARAVPAGTSPPVHTAVDAAQAGTSSAVEPIRAEPVQASPAVELPEETMVGTRFAVDSTGATPVEMSFPVETPRVMPDEIPRVREAVPAMRPQPPADSVVPSPAPHVSREPDRFDSARAPMVREPSRESTRESRRAAGGAGPASRRESVVRARSTPDGRAETGSRYGVAEVATSAGGPAHRAQADYLSRIQAWLEEHKEYPFRARLRREEGTAVLYFSVERDGRVRDYELRQSTGHALLDREVLALMEPAQPLPRLPDNLISAPLELIVPIRFRLR